MDVYGKSNHAFDAKFFRRYWITAKRHIYGPVGLLATIILILCLCGMLLMERVHTSNPVDQPLVKALNNFMPEATFRELNAKLPTHPFIKQNGLEEDNFKHTKGWLIKFNKDGLRHVRGIKELELVLPYIDAVLDWKANAFVMNLLIASPPPDGEVAVGTHVDDTIAMKHDDWNLWLDEFLAHKVNVLYTNVPKGIVGGELSVWPHEHDESERNKAVIQPMENTMVEFRGDAFHMVEGFQTPNGEPRISLVFEQYRIPKRWYDRTVEFCQDDECGKLEMEGSWRFRG